jgi:hypothetical protein
MTGPPLTAAYSMLRLAGQSRHHGTMRYRRAIEKKGYLDLLDATE